MCVDPACTPTAAQAGRLCLGATSVSCPYAVIAVEMASVPGPTCARALLVKLLHPVQSNPQPNSVALGV